jgi:hypothetical protein
MTANTKTRMVAGAAALTVASAEGTVVMCRTLRSAKPLDDVQAELR